MTARPAPDTRARGRFITVEGGEGAGKSTLVERLVGALGERGIRAVATREPGGSAGAEEIRALLLGGATERWDPVAETLLLMAARRDHLRRTVWPAIAAGRWVVCDRYADSTRAYQGAGKGVDPAFIEHVQRSVDEGRAPDLTLVLDLPAALGRARARARRGKDDAAGDRFEALESSFHERLHSAFRAIAEAEPGRCAVLDATAPPDDLLAAALRAIGDRLPLPLRPA
ncbi:MAG: dTMP kinase [Alphaproteobacteria bacterium]|nr:dTMP kinase [Alphaproteobacteria bacterium]